MSNGTQDPAGEKMVKESDLLAIKGSLEGKLQKAEAAVVEANSVAETAKSSLSETQQKLYSAEAQVKELGDKVKQGTSSTEELTRVKQDLVNAQKSVEGLSSKVLESRRQLVAATFNINSETVKTKTLEQLDAFEEALKAVAAAKGIGNFAVGGATGGGSLVGLSPMELARRAYEEKK